MSDCDLSIIIPTHGRTEKLRTLLQGIASTHDNHSAFEVIVVVDGHDEAPLKNREVLPESISFCGLCKDHAGPAAARNHAIEHASGEWVLFYDDDARVDGNTIGGHLTRIRADPQATDAYLGRVDWPGELVNSPWRQLLANSSMLFFWDQMRSDRCYGFRHFWTSNLSVRRSQVRTVGGFCERFPTAMHEDIELGWRLHQSFGTRVRVDKTIHSLHDHALGPRDYLEREHKSGVSAQAARSINPKFHDAVWPWLNDPASMLDTVTSLFGASCRDTLTLLISWAEEDERTPSSDEMNAVYLAHLPLKRIVFLDGYLGRPFDDLWRRLTGDELR